MPHPADYRQNGHANGTPVDLKQQLRDQRLKLRLLESQMASRRLEQTVRLLESSTAGLGTNYDWVLAYTDLLSRYRNEPNAFQVATLYDRRYGKNYPMHQNETELALLRMPSRILCSTNGYAIGLMEGLVSYVIHQGFVYRATSVAESEPELAAAVQEIVDSFLKHNQWYGGYDQPSLEEELFWRSVEDGEFILLHFVGPGGVTTLRTIEPEQMTQTGSGWTWAEGSYGILTPPDDVQLRQAAWIFFGDNPSDGEEFPFDRLTHFRRNAKRSIKRGMPDFSFSSLESLEQADRLRRNMSAGATQRAAIVGVRQHDNATKEAIISFQDAMTDYQRVNVATGNVQNYRRYDMGTWEDIPKGMNYVEGPASRNTEDYVAILQACLRCAIVRWNAPEWLGSGLHDTSSFASSLTAESPFVRTVERRQTGYKEAFLRSIRLAVKNHILARKEIVVMKTYADGHVGEERYNWEQVNRLIEIQAEPPSCQTRDKMQEAEANKIRLEAGWKSPQTIQQEEGLDTAREIANIKEWAKVLPKAGEALGGPGMGMGGLGGGNTASPFDQHQPRPGQFMPGGWRWPAQHPSEPTAAPGQQPAGSSGVPASPLRESKDCVPPTKLLPESHGYPCNIRVVDAEAMRTCSPDQEEFGQVAVHDDFPRVIPKDEIWIADNIEPRERMFLVSNALRRLQLLRDGKSSDEAYQAGIREERKVRERADMAGKKSPDKPKEVPDDVYVKPFEKVSVEKDGTFHKV